MLCYVMLQTVITNLRCAKNGIWGGDLTNYADCSVKIHDGNLTVVDESVYRATACKATHYIAAANLSVRPSVRPSDACIVTKLNDALRIF